MLALFVWLLHIIFGRNSVENRYYTETARNILSKRYVRGEITKEEYNSILKDI